MDFDFYDLDDDEEEYGLYEEEPDLEDVVVPPSEADVIAGQDAESEDDAAIVQSAEPENNAVVVEPVVAEPVAEVQEPVKSPPVEVETPVQESETESVESSPDTYEVAEESTEDVSTDHLKDPIGVTKRSGNIVYPFLFLEYEGDAMPKYKTTALQSMLASTNKVRDVNVMMFNVYLKCSGQVIMIGETSSYSLKALLTSSVFAEFKKYIKLDPDTKLEGNMMFAVCGLSI